MRMFVVTGCLAIACSSAIADGMSDRASLSAAAEWVEHQQARLNTPDVGQAMLADRLVADEEKDKAMNNIRKVLEEPGLDSSVARDAQENKDD